MPRTDLGDEMEELSVIGPGTFVFSAVRPENLGASEYTLVSIVCDISSSVASYSTELLLTIKKIIEACRKSERSENLMIRFVVFNADVDEVHGFKELYTIKADDYEDLRCAGMTALYDATYSSIGAILTYSETLMAQDFDVNGAVYILTDGEDNRSSLGPNDIKKLMGDAMKGEKIESLITVLIGLEDNITDYLEVFKIDAGLTDYTNVGRATPQKLAKLAEFVSQSISSQSNALGSGSPSQPPSVTF